MVVFERGALVWTYNLPFTSGSVVELGGGAQPMFRPNIDVRPGPQVDQVADLEDVLPVASNAYDGVFCRYAIEHLSWRTVGRFIAEIYRILRPSGTVVVITADAEAQMKWALAQSIWDEKISQCLGGDQDYRDNTHKVFFNPIWIARLFSAAGFRRVIVIPHGELGTDMIVESTK